MRQKSRWSLSWEPPLSQLLLGSFMYWTANFMVVPILTDITMVALCPGSDQCSHAIYISGLQQAISGIGTMLVTPIIGDLSDEYGRKPLLMIPMTVSIIPLAVLAYSRTKPYVYAYFVLRTAAAIVSEGGLHCLSLAFVADNIPEHSRPSAFGVLTGVVSSAFVAGLVTARFLPVHVIFQVATILAAFAALYMRVFLVEPKLRSPCLPGTEPVCHTKPSLWSRPRLTRSTSSIQDTAQLFKRSLILAQVSVITFFSNLGEAGLQGSLLYYLKARFFFDKDQFADLMLIAAVAGAVSQLFLMPFLTQYIGEKKLLCMGLFACFLHTLLYGIAWAPWVTYVAALAGVLFVFVFPCIGSIVSKEAGVEEQGKVQGCVSGIRSFATIISPLAISPLTALFLSEKAPFHCPGFSLICAAFAMMIAFVQACVMRPSPAIAHSNGNNYMKGLSHDEEQATLNTALLPSSS
uniref:TSA: Wollemia nobilis Ref_Wollemi_Transcript_9975_1906 transcribed RNA sequence n=1 Tax=Wollemia nobilis TaxID=56998 RepID=A0A0C9QTW5_9CONI